LNALLSCFIENFSLIKLDFVGLGGLSVLF